MNTVLRDGKPVERMRYTGYVVLQHNGRQSAQPRISSNNRASVREYVRETSLWIAERRRAIAAGEQVGR